MLRRPSPSRREARRIAESGVEQLDSLVLRFGIDLRGTTNRRGKEGWTLVAAVQVLE